MFEDGKGKIYLADTPYIENVWSCPLYPATITVADNSVDLIFSYFDPTISEYTTIEFNPNKLSWEESFKCYRVQHGFYLEKDGSKNECSKIYFVTIDKSKILA